MKKILFSPLGGTDPISETNYYEGAMLHIVRHYKPNEIYLYLSKEILEKEKNDNRYTYCLKKLLETEDIKANVSLIERGDLEDVHDFNIFYDDFYSIISNLKNKLSKDDELILNVSSGSPAMKSCLYILKELDGKNIRAVQVATPEKGMNEHNHKIKGNEDIELLWELNKDNIESKNRCSEVKYTNLVELKKKEFIKKHIMNYDYSAALDIAKTGNNKKLQTFLKLGQRRLLLDLEAVDKYAREVNFKKLPYSNEKEKRKIFEYVLSLEIKCKKRYLGDFIRALSPIIFKIFSLVLNKNCNINYLAYCEKNSKGIYVWSEEKLKNNPNILHVLTDSVPAFRYAKVYSSTLIILIEKLCNNHEIIDLVKKLRIVESRVRNIAAHEITYITDERIRALTVDSGVSPNGIASNEIMETIKRLLKYIAMNIDGKFWDSYDIMNMEIEKVIFK
mgnify:CR=1 FL=1